jgi:hypothetical protein
MMQLTPRDTSNLKEKATEILFLIKAKIKLSLSSIKHHIIKTYGGVEVYVLGSEPRYYTNVIHQLHTPADCPFGTNHRTHLIGGLVDPRPGVDPVPQSFRP